MRTALELIVEHAPLFGDDFADIKALKRAARELTRGYKSMGLSRRSRYEPELIPFVVNLRASDVPPWVAHEELDAAVRGAVIDAVTRLAGRSVTPGQLLARKNVPAEMRSKAARSMLAMRGGRAMAAKMRAAGFPNLQAARAAKAAKAAERRARKADL